MKFIVSNDAVEEMVQSMIAEIKTALRQFGEYTFHDKGPSEVMNLHDIANRLRAMPVADAVQALESVVAARPEEGERFVSELMVGSLEDWDELFDEHAPWANFVREHY